ncbi:MAG TPA: hypothetical protein PLT76_04570 [Candidatus Omnitrophota bacterium]|nr:hypothetical protein [Candidatus Omnitrophota bacterium]HPB69215.1 hypothetical protein [Candidatus Omnitrophota bacterium]HQO57973.1 hypothetical protein [Candidatus Omnitrophota bacterium]HQP13013.1 hypothetical protein [Candidatus Omnitrophota bacterium]
MTSSEQENKEPSQNDVPQVSETPSAAEAKITPEEGRGDGTQSPAEGNSSAPQPLAVPQAQSGAEKKPGADLSPQPGPDWGNNPKKILQELEKECDSGKGEKTTSVSDTPSVPPGSPVLPDHPLSDDTTADDLMTEAMRELDVLLKQIRENP